MDVAKIWRGTTCDVEVEEVVVGRKSHE